MNLFGAFRSAGAAASKFASLKSTTLKVALRGCEPGRMQSVGYMRVIPLTSDLVDDRFVPPMGDNVRVGTVGYGSLNIANESDGLLIVPCHAAYVVKQAAQDHAMSRAGVVGRRKRQTFDTARCVQQSQGGLIRDDNHRLTILPYSLRETALKDRKDKMYDRLWDAIHRFNQGLGVTGSANLCLHMARFAKQLDEFVAEFEPVPRQVGAVILIDGQVAGIERAPNYEYWLSVWPTLIRECYGSLAIETAKQKGDSPPPESGETLNPEVQSLEELANELERVMEVEERRAREIVRGLLDEPLDVEQDDRVDGLTLDTLSSERFFGQQVRDGENVVYASVIMRQEVRRRQKWTDAQPFAI